MIGVLHVGLGNVGSLCNCLTRMGKEFKILTTPDFEGCDQLLFPGVGHFAAAAKILDNGWRESMIAWVNSGKSIIGICLGFQLLFEGSEEAPGAKGLGFFKAYCSVVPSQKIPHMGWNRVSSHDAMAKDFDGQHMYFVHSYAPPAIDETVLTTQDGSDAFTVAVWKDGVGGFQFHPEKSSAKGQEILQSFLEHALC